MRLMMRLLLSVVTFFILLMVPVSCLYQRPPSASKIPPIASDGAISGSVCQPDGKTPIAGINVQVLVLEEYVTTPVVTVVTDANGKYTVSGLHPGRYIVWAQAPGYRLEEGPPQGTLFTVASGETIYVNFKMQVLCSISGRVFDESDGKAVANAGVYVGGWHWIVDGCPMAATAADGSYKVTDLNAGESTLFVVADGYVPRYYDGIYDEKKATMVTTRFGENTPDIDIGLEKGGSISGSVYQSDGITPAAMVNVIWQQILENATDVETPDPRVGFVTSGPSAVTNEEGNYIIGGLLTGKYLLIVKADQGASYSSTKVSVKIGELTPGADLKLVVSGSLSGHVYKSDARIPVGQGDVYVRVYSSTSPKDDGFYEGQGMTNQDGRYLIEEVPPGKYTVRVDVFTGPGTSGKTYTVNIISGKNTILDFVLQ
jgi:hypothetical protein